MTLRRWSCSSFPAGIEDRGAVRFAAKVCNYDVNHLGARA